MCEYAVEVRQDLARDKFVFGLTDDRLKEKLLREDNLDLATAVGQVQRAESSKRQIREMTTHSEVNAMQRGRNQPLPATSLVYCGNCGRQHKPRQCPAYGQKCTLCHKLNHFSRVCRSRQTGPQQRSSQTSTQSNSIASRKVNEIEHSDAASNSPTEESQDLFIEPLQINGLKKSTAWFADLNTSGGPLRVKLDTGAEVSVLPFKTYDKLHPQPPLKDTSMTLTAYGGMPIQPSGICQMMCSTPCFDNMPEVDFYVTPVDAHPILGLTDCVRLGLIRRVCSIQEGILTKQSLQE